ncbi:hypothetical protein ES703_90175 [subsurface metagenome]
MVGHIGLIIVRTLERIACFTLNLHIGFLAGNYTEFGELVGFDKFHMAVVE